MEIHVATISINLNLNGWNTAVQAATISLGVNAIPTIELTCPPSGLDAAPLRPAVENPDLVNLAEGYRRLSEWAEGLDKTGDVRITVKDSIGRTESISLKGWILTDAGMSSASAMSAPQLVMVLQHPICKLTKAGAIYETAKNNLHKDMQSKISAGPFLDVVDTVYDMMRKGDRYFWPSDNKYPPLFRKALIDPSGYLEDKTEGTFLKNAKGITPRRMAQAEAKLVLPASDGSSTWDMLRSTAAGHMLLSITQDQKNNYTTDKLVLEPDSRWKPASIVLDASRCSSTDLYGRDPFKLSGVMCRKLGPFNDQVNLGILKAGNMKTSAPMNRETVFVPKPYQDAERADGRIIKTSAPVLLEQQFWEDAPRGGRISSMKIDTKDARMKNYNEAMEKYCKAVYELSAGSMSRGTAHMVLGFYDSLGSLILPGNTCRFMRSKVSLYYGYIQKVVHSMSAVGGCATVVEMSNVRSGPGYTTAGGEAIPAHYKNAAWEDNW